MPLVVEAVGVGEVAVGHAQFLGLGVHAGHEVLHAPPAEAGDGQGRVVAGVQEQTIQ